MGRKISNFLLALIGFLFLVCFSVVLTLNLRGIYYSEIKSQQLTQLTGLSEAEIRENYDVLIDYNLITKGMEELEFPSFPMSEQGRIHFEEVKQIFTGIQYLCIATGGLFLAGLIWNVRKKDFRSLKLLSILTFVIPALLGTGIAFFWETVFVLFHKLFFHNDYWLFDERTDPVILILPDTFFARCAITILLFIMAGGVVSAVLYRIGRKGEQRAVTKRVTGRNRNQRAVKRRLR